MFFNLTDRETFTLARSPGRKFSEEYLDFCLDVGDSSYIMDPGAIVANGPIGHLNDDTVKQHLTV